MADSAIASVVGAAEPEMAPTSGGRGLDTTRRISRCALRLAAERGLDGFTMDTLAEAAGVSRRTLFNHVPGKVDAVLGPMPAPPPEALTVFRAGGPGGGLVDDLGVLVVAMLEFQQVDRDDLRRWKGLLATDERLLSATHQRFVRVSEHLVAEVNLREGERVGGARAAVAVGLLAAIFDAALEAFLADPDQRPLAHHVHECLALARELFTD